MIVVRHAKLDRQREVPLHDTTTRALGDYGRLRDRHFPQPTTQADAQLPLLATYLGQ